MLLLIKIELNKISKPKLFLAWLCTIFIVLGITAIIIMGLGTDNKLGEFAGQDSNVIRVTGKWEGWAIVASSSYIPVASQLINLAGITFGTVLIGLLPFVLGMIKHSTAITMLTGLGLAALLSNVSPGSLSNNIVDNLFFLIFASFISLTIVSFSIFTISRQDISIK